jgi:hypothetical protein
MNFLNGWKTILGAVGLGLTIVVSPEKATEIVTNADSLLTGAFGLLTVLGVIHKTEKRK